MQNVSLETVVTHGPNILTPYQSVILKIPKGLLDLEANVSSAQIDLIHSMFPGDVRNRFTLLSDASVSELLIDMTKAISSIRSPSDLIVEIKENKAGLKSLCIEYIFDVVAKFSSRVTLSAIQLVVNNQNYSIDQVKKNIANQFSSFLMISIRELMPNMLCTAKKLKVPFYLILDAYPMYIYGQGKNAVLYNYGNPEGNSEIGFKIQKDKSHTNTVVKRLGYPTTDQFVVMNFEQCVEASKKMGFPLVLKPYNMGQGMGITANIQNLNELKAAFQKARALTKEQIIIENYIEGDDHRISITNGKVNLVSRRRAPYVIGDGTSTVSALIAVENSRRAGLEGEECSFKPLSLHNEMLRLLQSQGLTPESIPVLGKKVQLGTIDNVSAGGTLKGLKEEDVHPDNITMASYVAKAMRMTSIGLDFMTPDISKSWREVGSIIEVNAYQMIGAEVAAQLFINEFEDKNFGRIDTALIVTERSEFGRKYFDLQKDKYSNPGYTENDYTVINDGESTALQDRVYDRCLSMILNPDCDAMIVTMTPLQIVQQGLPLDYFERVIIDTESDLTIWDTHSGEVDFQNWVDEYCSELQQSRIDDLK